MNGQRERVDRLLEAARMIQDPATVLGRRARLELLGSTRLSAEGIELGLSECLETEPTAGDLAALFASVRPAARTQVLLSGNVFVAAHRAIAVALAASERVVVRASRREPHFARLLAEAAPGLFELVTELEPAGGDALWAYGGTETLAALRARLPDGVELFAQGPGFGVAVLEAAFINAENARALAFDIVRFDQRGCLSPGSAIVVGDVDDALAFGRLLAAELESLGRAIPPGALEPEELAAFRRHRDTMAYARTELWASPGYVATRTSNELNPAPGGRALEIVATTEPVAVLLPRAGEITALGIAVTTTLERALRKALPGARTSALGSMQRPPLDGPADRRAPEPLRTGRGRQQRS